LSTDLEEWCLLVAAQEVVKVPYRVREESCSRTSYRLKVDLSLMTEQGDLSLMTEQGDLSRMTELRRYIDRW
jgi:hypothetical protein